MSAKKNTKKSSASKVGGTKTVLLSDKAPWPVQEAYKALRTNVTFSLPGTDSKVIAVTSATRHDGKSVNAINFAISFGEIGKKVLIIDCDMRLPTVATKLGIKAIPGISDFLAGQVKVSDAVVALPEYHIDVLPAGNIPPDPTRLLQSEQMGAMLAALKKYYDYIVIDLPPVTTVADAAILSHYVDGYLLVVRNESTEYRAVADMLEQLRFADAKIIGFIYNDAVIGTGKKYYRHYYYKKSEG